MYRTTYKSGQNAGNPPKIKRRKTMKCSPVVKGKTVSENTCYTTDILLKIVKSYNESHSRELYIPWTNPQKMWQTLKDRLVNCETEDCWLSQIKDAKLRKEIDTTIFAPDQPPEWKTNKNEWLTDHDIRLVMQQYEKSFPNFKFYGPTPIDFDKKVPASELPWYKGPKQTACVWEGLCNIDIKELQSQNIDKIGIVFNLDTYDEPGSHWVALFADLTPSRPYIFYFNSTGDYVPKEIKKLIGRMKKQYGNTKPPLKVINNVGTSHQKGNTECGMYCLFFIITMLTGDSGFEKNMSLDEKIMLFKDAKIPDKYVEYYRNEYYNSN